MVDSASMNGVLSTPLVLPAPMAGALAALFLVMVVIAMRRAVHDGGLRLLIPFCVIAAGAIAVIGVIDRLGKNERMAAQRDLLQRESQLSLSAIAPGSVLACLDGVAGEQAADAALAQQTHHFAQDFVESGESAERVEGRAVGGVFPRARGDLNERNAIGHGSSQIGVRGSFRS